MLIEKLDAANDDNPDAVVTRPNPLAAPFKNERSREVVREIAERVVEVATHCKFNDHEMYVYTLGLVQGARLVAQKDSDTILEQYVVEILSALNRRGVDAVKDLVEVVTGHPLLTNEPTAVAA